MKITEKGQVTIPKAVRDRFGLRPGMQVRFVEKGHRVVLEKGQEKEDVWDRYYGFLKMNRRTDELIRLMRGPRP